MSTDAARRPLDCALSPEAVRRREIILYQNRSRFPAEKIIPLLQAHNIKPRPVELREIGVMKPWTDLTKLEKHHAIFLILTNKDHPPKEGVHGGIKQTPLKKRLEWLVLGVPHNRARAIIQLVQLSLIQRQLDKKAARRRPKAPRGKNGRFEKKNRLFGRNSLTATRHTAR